MKRLITAVLLVLALLVVSFQAPAQSCGMSMRTVSAPSCDCCATMKSCVLPQQSPTQATATAQATQHSVVLIAPVVREMMTPIAAEPFRRTGFPIAQAPAHSPPRSVLFCTFLI